MNGEALVHPGCSNETAVERYYRLHAPVYDLTRWTFLFGRSAMLRRVASEGLAERILEVGCGTGRNLAKLGRLFPRAHITGIDLSSSMLERARRRVAPFGERIKLVHRRYDQPLHPTPTYNLVLFSVFFNDVQSWVRNRDRIRLARSRAGWTGSCRGFSRLELVMVRTLG